MLEPASRRLLLEAFQPPAEYRLDWAVGTTYSLDLTALLSAPIAFAFADCQDQEGRPVMDPLVLLKAVRQYADRICLFCQAGRIHVPTAYQPLLANLEHSIYEAIAPNGGSFHPKVWFLRYVTDDQAVSYRLLCLSRNLTFDRSWDTMLSIDGELRDRTNAYSSNHPLGDFVEALPTMSPRKIHPEWRKRLRQLAYEIRRVEFDVPEPFEEMAFWPMGIDEHETWPFPDKARKLLVISPFVDDRMLGDLADVNAPCHLVSRAESLAEISPSTVGLYDQVWTLDEMAEPEPTDHVDTGEVTNDAEIGPDARAVQQLPLVGLHAKLYIVDTGWKSHVYTGSANATQAAFVKNVEFLVELVGKRSRCGVDATLGATAEGDRKAAASLADLLQPYQPRNQQVEKDSEIEAFERSVDKLARRLAAAIPMARCEPQEACEGYGVRLMAGKRVTGIKLADFHLRVRPISLPATQWEDLQPEKEEWAFFSSVSLLGLTAFYVIEASNCDRSIAREFVLNIPLANAPEQRHQRILNDLLRDGDRVLRFLMLLLVDHGARDMESLMGGAAITTGEYRAFGAMLDGTLFESLMRALDRQPERIDQVASLIEDLQKTPEGQHLLPSDLDTIWQPIWEVRCQQEAGRRIARS